MLSLQKWEVAEERGSSVTDDLFCYVELFHDSIVIRPFPSSRECLFTGGRGDAGRIACWYFCRCVFSPFALSGCSLSPPILCGESAELVPVRTKGSYQKYSWALLLWDMERLRGLNEHLLLPGGRIKNCKNISHQNKKIRGSIFYLSSVCTFLLTDYITQDIKAM